jgi:GR25 family glycosyltransferase involved in LPS biosynthesis/glycosyltransferase involved in cell wall biosynthesis
MGKKNRNTKNPLVSIVTPTSKRPGFIKLLFKCIINQNYPIKKMEWIIVDGQNNKEKLQELPNIIKEFKKQSELKIIYYSLPMDENNKIGALRNKTNELANGNIIVCMDDDDYYPKNRVISAVKALKYGKLNLAGLSKIYIYDFDLDEIIQFGPLGNYHSTNNFMAYTKKYANNNKYINNCPSGEELKFTNNFTNKMVQLNPEYTGIQFSHYSNTFNKRKIFSSTYANTLTEKKKDIYKIIDKEKLLKLIPTHIYEEYLKICLPHKKHSLYSEYDIVYYCGTFSYVDWLPNNKSLGGSEQAIVKLTSYWASKGYKVAVYLPIQENCTFNNVNYISSNNFKVSLKYKTLILWRPAGFESIIQTKLNADNIYLDLHDTYPPLALKKYVNKVTKIFTKSKFHSYATLNLTSKDNNIQKKLKDKLIYNVNGIRVNEFKKNINNVIRNKYRFCYTSAYNRGLVEILEYFFPVLKKIIPEVELHIYYGYSKSVKDKTIMDRVKYLIENTEQVYEHGRVNINKIIEEKYKSNFHLYLTNTTAETDCIAIRESLVTGCIPIISTYGVFQERDGLKFDVDLNDKKSYNEIAIKISEIINKDDYCDKIREKLKLSDTILSWEDVGKKWLKEMNLINKLNSMKNVKKTYLINLEKRPDKLNEFIKSYPYDKENIDIFKAIDGSKLKINTPYLKNFITNYIKKNPKQKNGPNKGELGCTLSHLSIWNLIKLNDDLEENDLVAVFEDDAFFTTNFEKIWNQINIPNNTDFIYIGGRFSDNYLPNEINKWNKISNYVYKTNFDDRTTHGYIVTKKGAKKLLNLVELDNGIYKEIDHWLMSHMISLNSYTILPLLCWSPRNYKSDIIRNGKDTFNLNLG